MSMHVSGGMRFGKLAAMGAVMAAVSAANTAPMASIASNVAPTKRRRTRGTGGGPSMSQLSELGFRKNGRGDWENPKRAARRSTMAAHGLTTGKQYRRHLKAMKRAVWS